MASEAVEYWFAVELQRMTMLRGMVVGVGLMAVLALHAVLGNRGVFRVVGGGGGVDAIGRETSRAHPSALLGIHAEAGRELLRHGREDRRHCVQHLVRHAFGARCNQ